LEIDVEAGRHLIEVTRSGYRPWSKWLELKPGDDRTIELVMARADAGGALPAAVGVAGVGMAAGGLALGAGGGGGGGGESSPGLSLGTGGSADPLSAGGAPPAQPGAPRPAAAVAGKESLGERRKRTEGLGRLPTTTSLYSIAAFNSDVVVALRGTLPNGRDFEVELEESNDYTDYGVGFRFGDLLNPFVEVGASLHVWFGNTDVGTDTDVNRFILSPFMKLRVPVLPGPQGDLLEVYGLATGGLQIYAYTSDTTKDQEAAGDRLQEINFGWLVGAAAGAQLNLTRNLGLFAEGGVIRSRVSIGLSELRGQQVTEGEFVIDLLEPYASFGLVFLH
jgi:hypothetical protein